MATATAPADEKKKPTAEDLFARRKELLLALADGPVPDAALHARFGPAVMQLAWARGEIEFGTTKYVTTGNPETAITMHNGVSLPAPTVIIEGGEEWTGPKQRWHDTYTKLREGATLPERAKYQKYQLEVCVNKDKDAWEWLDDPKKRGQRETRFARRDIDRAAAEELFALTVRLTDKGAEAL